MYTHGGQNTQVLEYVLKIDTDIGATLNLSGYPRMYVSVYTSYLVLASVQKGPVLDMGNLA